MDVFPLLLSMLMMFLIGAAFGIFLAIQRTKPKTEESKQVPRQSPEESWPLRDYNRSKCRKCGGKIYSLVMSESMYWHHRHRPKNCHQATPGFYKPEVLKWDS